ncbi:phage holin family protein [Aurantimonas aggregata]|uniref:Phage holin family protein n=1 Tax=Aurantimonas aggregata TaxID=2047720 RepID=A0A6L9MDJ7_9HYPH|nr:phage holin family protein [Aurantimonas aggregata]NDV85855.1 phage holin family protein [Aurantimonas aggregata]
MSVEPRESRSVTDLITDLIRETGELVRTESRLVRAEISDKVRQVEMGGGSLAAGAICLLVALFVLAQALIVALGNVIGDAWAALLVGVVIAAIGMALLAKGRRDLAPSNLMPDRSTNQLNKDGQLVKEQIR